MFTIFKSSFFFKTLKDDLKKGCVGECYGMLGFYYRTYYSKLSKVNHTDLKWNIFHLTNFRLSNSPIFILIG